MGIGSDYPYKLLVDKGIVMFSFKHTRNSFECLLNMVVLEVFNIHKTYTGHTLDLHRKAFGIQKVFRVLRALPVQYTSRVQSASTDSDKACFRHNGSMPLEGLEHNSGSSGACLWKVWSMPLEGLEHVSGRPGALLLVARSIALGSWEHCSWNTKACLSGVRKHVF